ncbi:hypothetical protein C3941_00110 [Kaistia algarum]|uniref:DUF4238 domain-containing protein n=1 Tax=Kaistia algarum TaxID=2083279 RepID=UPI000CE754D1|nr:hypothetical protein C3941_00110 [Kaistia algarum]
MSVARRHHYVPRFLLRQWVVPYGNHGSKLLGHYWDPARERMRLFPCSPKQVCYREDLFGLRGKTLPPDAIERRFFSAIDDSAAVAHRKLLSEGVASLTVDERSDLVRLILSLEVRRPANIEKLVSDGAESFRDGLDRDPEIAAAFAKHGLSMSPSEYYEQGLGYPLSDRAMLLVQHITNSRNSGLKLASFIWRLRRLDPRQGSFVLSDRPLYRSAGIDAPNALWSLPCSPYSVLLMSPSEHVLQHLLAVSDSAIVRAVNADSANQADKYLFGTRQEGEWLERRLRAKYEREVASDAGPKRDAAR